MALPSLWALRRARQRAAHAAAALPALGAGGRMAQGPCGLPLSAPPGLQLATPQRREAVAQP
eukprot:2759024-Lingulodinium_polyedra.AAC.1